MDVEPMQQGGGLRCLFSDRNDRVSGLTYAGREIFMLCRPWGLVGRGSSGK